MREEREEEDAEAEEEREEEEETGKEADSPSIIFSSPFFSSLSMRCANGLDKEKGAEADPFSAAFSFTILD
jgi:hypothetical protein